jgi:tetratricopeptide (TPR) repeat protein
MAKRSNEEVTERLRKVRGLIQADDSKKARKEALELIKDISDDSPQRAEGHLLLAEAMTALAEFDHAFEHVGKAQRIAEHLKSDKLMAKALYHYGHIRIRTSELEQARKDLTKGLEISRRAEDKATEGLTVIDLALLEYFKGDLDKAEAGLREAVLILDKIGDRKGVARVYNNLAALMHRRGKKERSVEFFDKAIIMSKKAGAMRYMALAIMNKAGILDELDRPEEARKEMDEALAIFEELGDRFLISKTYLLYGLAHAKKKEWPEAEEYLQKARLLVKSIGMPSNRAIVLLEMGKVCLLKGDRDTGLRYIQEAKTIFKEHNFSSGLTYVKETLEQYDRDQDDG